MKDDTVQSALATSQECLAASNEFGIVNNVTFGFAPNDIRSWWSQNGCSTSPDTSTDLCQKASEIFGIAANVTWGFAPTEVQQWWTANNCNTAPLFQEPICKRAADTYGITANLQFGSAPPYIKSWWMMNGCNESRHNNTTCEMVADFFGVVANQHFGFAPSDVQTWWSANHCTATTTTSTAQLCQNASNFYAIVANQTFGGAPAGAQSWWTSNSCAATPKCQGLSEMFGIRANVTWGAAGSPASPVPTYIQNWWTGNNCATSTLFVNDTCQQLANVFNQCSSGAGQAPGFIKQYCASSSCNTVATAFPQFAGASNFWHFMPFFFGAAPSMPTGLTITQKTSAFVLFSLTQNDPGLVDIQIDASSAQDGSRTSTIFSVPHGTFNGNLGLSSFQNQTTPCMRIRASKHAETPSFTMWSNSVCFNAPPPSVVNLGLGSGVFFCTTDLSNCSFGPTLNTPFKLFWSVCNSGSSTAPASTTMLKEMDPFGEVDDTEFPVSAIPAGACVNQHSDTLSADESGRWEWSVMADSDHEISETFEMDNFGSIGSNF